MFMKKLAHISHRISFCLLKFGTTGSAESDFWVNRELRILKPSDNYESSFCRSNHYGHQSGKYP